MVVNLKDVKRYPNFKDFCDNVYCATKNPGVFHCEDCKQCRLDYNIALTIIQQGEYNGYCYKRRAMIR